MTLDPQMRAILDDLTQAEAPDLFALPPDAARALVMAGNGRWNQDLPTMELADSVMLDSVPAERRRPAGARPGVILYVHGGGWMFGAPETHERALRCLALATRREVLAPRYPLAPEAPFPAGQQTCLRAWAALADYPGPHIIAGDSAGANLALSVLLADGVHADAGLGFYGVYGADFDTPSYRAAPVPGTLDRGRMMAYWDRYAPPGLRSDPAVAPLCASDAALAALPPLFLNAAGHDPLCDDTRGLVARLQALGRSDAFVLHPGVVHGFMQMTRELAEARFAFGCAGAWVQARFDD